MTRDVTLGILGGVGPAAGVLLHQAILNHTENAGTDQGHFSVIHISRSGDVSDRSAYLKSQDGTVVNPSEGMSRTLDKCCRAASKPYPTRLVAGVPCNTFHSASIWTPFASHAQAQHDRQSLVLIHMLEETMTMIATLSPHCRRVGLLCTTGTRESRVYHTLLEPRGYTVVETSHQAGVHEAIYNNLWGIKATAPAITPKAVKAFHRYADELTVAGAEVIVMGCTEIPFAFVGFDRTVGGAILIDPLVALARGMIRQADPTLLKPLMGEQPSKRVMSLSKLSQRSFPNREFIRNSKRNSENGTESLTSSNGTESELDAKGWQIFQFYTDFCTLSSSSDDNI